MTSDIKQCPYCAEDIKAAAIVCKHCGRELPEYSQKIGGYPASAMTDSMPDQDRNRILRFGLASLAIIGIVSFFLYALINLPFFSSEDLARTATPDSIASIFSSASTEQARQTEEFKPTELPVTVPQATVTSIPTGIAEVTIPASEAHQYEGQSVTIEIPKAYCSYRPTTNGEPTFCNDQPFPGHNFTLLVWGQDWSHFDGQCIWVTGTVELFEGISEIVVDTPSQVTLCPE